MTARFYEPDELRLAGDLADWLNAQETKWEYQVEAVFHFDGEATGVMVQRDGGGNYSVSVE